MSPYATGGSWSERLAARAGRLRRWLAPPGVELPAAVRQAVAAVYPTLDLSRVHFHAGIPHVFDLSPKEGITLPAAWPPGGSRVYLHPRALEKGPREVASLVLHEAFHALQIQECRFGLGLAHPFILLYLATAAGNGFRYWGHPLEADAYRVAGSSRSLIDRRLRNDPHAHAGEGGEGEELGGEALHDAVTAASGLAFWPKLARSTPGLGKAAPWAIALAAPWVGLWFLGWGAVALLCGVGQLALMAGGRLAAGLFAAVGWGASRLPAARRQ